MSRVTDFTDAINAAVVAAEAAASGKGFTEAYVQQARLALLTIQSEIGEGDNPAETPLEITDPEA